MHQVEPCGPTHQHIYFWPPRPDLEPEPRHAHSGPQNVPTSTAALVDAARQPFVILLVQEEAPMVAQRGCRPSWPAVEEEELRQVVVGRQGQAVGQVPAQVQEEERTDHIHPRQAEEHRKQEVVEPVAALPMD